MTYVAKNPRSLPAEFEYGRSLVFSMMAQSLPMTADQRLARLARTDRLLSELKPRH